MKNEATAHRCPLCGGHIEQGETVFTAELGFGVVVVRHVPATTCRDCGESWLDDETADRLETMVDRARREQSQVEVIAYKN